MNQQSLKIVISLLLIFCLGTATPPESLAQTTTTGPNPSYIDAHNHLSRGQASRPDFSSAARIALAEMDNLGISRMIIMPPPFSSGHRGLFDFNDLIPVMKNYPDRIAVFGGGGSLNIMIHQNPNPDSVTPELKARFEKTAEDLLSKGAIGFGELAVDHFSFASDHPYESVAADHPLFLLLAEIAARHNVPIDIHMEAIPRDMPLPDRRLLRRSGNNPPTLKENISALERLLAHKPEAKIIWAHVGWCNTGFRTPDLCRRLLSKHPNLYMSFKLSPESLPETRPIGEDRQFIKPEWLQLLKEFPDRFIIGTDQFYVPLGSRPIGPQKTEATRLFMTLLPPNLARQIGTENPERIFNLKK